MSLSPSAEDIRAIGPANGEAHPAFAALSPRPEPRRMDVRRRPPAPGDAFDLLAEVAVLLPTLTTTCADLEAAIAAKQTALRDDLVTIAEVALQWQRLTQDLKQQVQRLMDVTADCRRRAEKAEADVATLTIANDTSHQAASKAAAVNARFEQTILAAFGVGSPGRAALETFGQTIAGRAA